MPANRLSRYAVNPALQLLPSGSTYYRSLTAGVAISITVPSGATLAVFHAPNGGRFFARYDGFAASVLTGSVDDSPIEDSPSARDVADVEQVSVVSAVALDISIAFYRNA